MFEISKIGRIKYRLCVSLFFLCLSGLAASQESVNQAPRVNDDVAVVALGQEVVVDILANDTGDIDPSTVAIYVPQQPESGYLGINSQTGAITYTPYIGLTSSGSDSFGYTVRSNTSILSEVATVSITLGRASNGNDGNNIVVEETEMVAVSETPVAVIEISDPEVSVTEIPEQEIPETEIPDLTIAEPEAPELQIPELQIPELQIPEQQIPEQQVSGPEFSEPSNDSLQAGNDSAVVTLGSEVVVDVLANDTGDINPSSVAIYVPQQPELGYLGINSQTGAITYTPYIGITDAGLDSFGYTIRNNSGVLSNVATVSVAIRAEGSSNEVQVTEVESEPVSTPVTPEPVPTVPEIVPVELPQPEPQPESEPVVDVTVVVSGALTALRRTGQTFLTWQEIGASNGYHVYRHNVPINAGNLSSAFRVTDRWGPLDNNTSRNTFGGPRVPANFVINDLAAPLSNNTGLFVYTTQPGDSSIAYYAVTSVNSSGNENSLITLNSPVTESVATPADVLTVSVNQGRGRVYTQFMDYSNWNPTLNGYAYNYAVALPSNYNPSVSYPLMLELHAYSETFKAPPASEFNWPVITLLPHDPGPSVGARHSWWYGYSRDHDYSNGGLPKSGRIENFTEQRVMRAIDAVIGDASFNVDANKVHAFGHSMGGSGVLSLGMRYGSIISGVYASEPMTNYAENSLFASELFDLWGLQSSALRTVNSGPHSNDIQAYDVGVWDWMNHQKQLVDRRGDDMAFLMTFHGKQDRVIEWQTQGRPIANALTNGSAGFAARNLGSISHTWVGFVSVNTSLFGFGFDDDFAWKYPLDLSFPSIQNASGSSPSVPANGGDDEYNISIDWATPHTPFAAGIIDTSSQYAITLRSLNGAQTADITPRRTQSFDPLPGQQCSWSAVNNNNGTTIGAGSSTADSDSLITISDVSIVTGTGTRLSINCL